MSPSGSVERVLGALTDAGVDVLAVAYGFGLSLEFTPEVLAAAEEAARVHGAEPGPDRVDRTDLLCFTIDPADAKDHDDALSIVTLDEHHAEIGVHIADVSHFVPPGSAVDTEAPQWRDSRTCRRDEAGGRLDLSFASTSATGLGRPCEMGRVRTNSRAALDA